EGDNWTVVGFDIKQVECRQSIATHGNLKGRWPRLGESCSIASEHVRSGLTSFVRLAIVQTYENQDPILHPRLAAVCVPPGPFCRTGAGRSNPWSGARAPQKNRRHLERQNQDGRNRIAGDS